MSNQILDILPPYDSGTTIVAAYDTVHTFPEYAVLFTGNGATWHSFYTANFDTDVYHLDTVLYPSISGLTFSDDLSELASVVAYNGDIYTYVFNFQDNINQRFNVTNNTAVRFLPGTESTDSFRMSVNKNLNAIVGYTSLTVPSATDVVFLDVDNNVTAIETVSADGFFMSKNDYGYYTPIDDRFARPVLKQARNNSGTVTIRTLTAEVSSNAWTVLPYSDTSTHKIYAMLQSTDTGDIEIVEIDETSFIATNKYFLSTDLQIATYLLQVSKDGNYVTFFSYSDYVSHMINMTTSADNVLNDYRGMCVYNTGSNTYGPELTSFGGAFDTTNLLYVGAAGTAVVGGKTYMATRLNELSYRFNLTDSTVTAFSSTSGHYQFDSISDTGLVCGGRFAVLQNGKKQMDVVFTDLNNTDTVVDTLSASDTFISKQGYGYYTDVQVNGIPIGLKQASIAGGTTTIKTLSTGNDGVSLWTFITSSPDGFIYASKRYNDADTSENRLDVYKIQESDFTATLLWRFLGTYSYPAIHELQVSVDGKVLLYKDDDNWQDDYPYNFAYTDTQVVSGVLTVLSAIAPTIIPLMDQNDHYNFVIIGNTLSLMNAGTGILIDRTLINLNGSAVEYIGIWPKPLFLRLRLLGYF